MDTLFENTYVRDKQFVKEFYFYANFKRPLMWVLYAFVVACFSYLAYVCIKNNVFHAYLLVFPAYVGFVLFRYFYGIHLTLKRQAESGYENFSIKVTVTEDQIQFHREDEKSPVVALSQMKSWVATKHYIYVRSKTKQYYILSKDGFTKGTEQAFYEFLGRKGIKKGL